MSEEEREQGMPQEGRPGQGQPQQGPAGREGAPPGPPPGGAGAPGAAPPEGIGEQERTWAIFTHLSAFAAFIGVPFGNILGPLIIWLIKREEMPFVDRHGKEALNFQISMTIYAVVAGILTLIIIGFFALIALAILEIVFIIMAAVAASKSEEYQYPLTIRFLR